MLISILLHDTVLTPLRHGLILTTTRLLPAVVLIDRVAHARNLVPLNRALEVLLDIGLVEDLLVLARSIVKTLECHFLQSQLLLDRKGSVIPLISQEALSLVRCVELLLITQD